MCQDIAAEIFRRKKSRIQDSKTIKDVIQPNLKKELWANLFNKTVLPAIVYASKMYTTTK